MTAMFRQLPGSGMGEEAWLVFLAERGQRTGISIRVIPASAGSHTGAHAGGVLLLALAAEGDRSRDVARGLDRVVLSPSESRARVRESVRTLRAGRFACRRRT